MELVCDGFERYPEEHRNCITGLLDDFMKRRPGYRKYENQYGIFIRKEIPYPLASPEDLACNMAVLIKETILQLWENGIIDTECIKPLLRQDALLPPEAARVNLLF